MNGNENKWREMNAGEWRGKFGEMLEGMRTDLHRLRNDVESVAGVVHRHAADIAVLQDRDERAQLGWKPRAIIAASLIGAITSIIITLIN